MFPELPDEELPDEEELPEELPDEELPDEEFPEEELPDELFPDEELLSLLFPELFLLPEFPEELLLLLEELTGAFPLPSLTSISAPASLAIVRALRAAVSRVYEPFSTFCTISGYSSKLSSWIYLLINSQEIVMVEKSDLYRIVLE